MTARQINRMSGTLPLVFSAAAFVLVMANIVAGTPPQPDENASAHLWQLLMALQLPLIGLFVVTADWSRWRTPATILIVQGLAIVAAAVPVWLAGY